MSVKKLPGVAPVYMVYDKRDRLVMTQDGNLRDSTKWLFTKYDRLNRPVMTGLHHNNVVITRDSMQSLVNASMTVYYEDMTGDFTDENFGYTNQSFPVLGAGDEILTVTYYDNYDFDAGNIITSFTGSFNIDGDYPDSLVNYYIKGKVTGFLAKVLGEEKYLLTATYYDDKYRVLRVFNENIFGGKEVTLNKYDFIGNVLKSRLVIYKDTATTSPVIINRWNDLDHVYRPKDIYHEIVGKDTVHMAKMSYNEIGQLKTKQLHETSNGYYLQNIDYTYNIRGWLTDINDPETTSDNLFALSLQYNDTTGVGSLGALPMYNGNISGMKWKQNAEDLKGYSFRYDALNRLTTSVYGQGPELDQLSGKYNELVGSYDLNGNILSLNRSGEESDTVYTDLDNLGYYYEGNMLIAVEDQGQKGHGFIDGHEYSSGQEYEYDSNGNMIKDLNKGIVKIKYNYLNLPSEVIHDATHKVMYTYDATGVKLKKRLISDGNITDRYYTGTYEYDNNMLPVLIHFDEGVVNVTGSTYDYEYFLKDHLGNIRASFKPSGDTLISTQKVDYYPFGMIAYANGASNNKYLYNEKELQDDDFGGASLQWYDYGARFYDPQIGRWHVVDPDAESYFAYGPYVYVGNNPIRRIDPAGDTAWDVVLGFFAAVVDNATGGLTNARTNAASHVTDADDFNRGQNLGDSFSVLLGASMVEGGKDQIALGTATATASVAVELESGGTSTVTLAGGGGLVLSGMANVAEGTVLAVQGTKNLAAQKGRLPENKPGTTSSKPASQTSAGRATDKYGNKLGPSGEPQVNTVEHSTQKGAKDAARNYGKGAPVKHTNPKKGGDHYHPTNKDGEKKPNSTHHEY